MLMPSRERFMFAPKAKYGILSAQLAVHQAGREADGRYGSDSENLVSKRGRDGHC
jgi:hypothetical protein